MLEATQYYLTLDYVYNILTVLKWSPIVLLITHAFVGVWFYLMSLILYVYKWRKRKVFEAFDDSFWDGFRSTLAAITEAQGHFWHNYKVQGIENLPKKGGALLVGYHGALPIDAYYLVAAIFEKRRKVRIVVDKFLFKVPGLRLLLEVLNSFPGSVNDCVQALNNGEILLIYPGGLREAMLSDENYKLLWKTRRGYSRVAVKAEVPIIPFFTENIREACWAVKFSIRLASYLYEKTKFPILPLIGIFPVGLTTYFGKPVWINDHDDPNVTPVHDPGT